MNWEIWPFFGHFLAIFWPFFGHFLGGGLGVGVGLTRGAPEMALVWQRTPTSGRIKAGSGQRLGRVTVTVAAESEPQGRLTAGEGRLTGGQGATVGWHFQHWHRRKERPMERETDTHTEVTH